MLKMSFLLIKHYDMKAYGDSGGGVPLIHFLDNRW
jgi:hypothetical protein